MAHKTIEQVQEAYTPKWMAIPGVQGTAIGLFKGKPCIKILLSISAEKLGKKVPAAVEGYPVVVEETGAFQSLDSP